MRGWLRLMPGKTSLRLARGCSLRLLTAMEVLEARREAEELVCEDRERALCSNACLLAKALVRRGKPLYMSGREILEKKSVREIQALAKAWADFDRENNPGLTLRREEADRLKKSLGHTPEERLRWRVLRTFGALPTEMRARKMTGRDYLWCALHLLLDQEEELDALCPACRAEAEEKRCPGCGREMGNVEENLSFDRERFERLKRGEMA